MDLLARLRAVPGAAAPLDAVAGEPGVHVVGGAVRDVLLGREPRELDFVVEGEAEPVARRAAGRLGGSAVVHERFATATVLAPDAVFDVVSARRERYPRPGALPEVEVGAPLKEDLERRDFTVNTLAVSVQGGLLAAVDGATEDLDARLLRVMHDRSFRDDPTRLVRMARYAARLGFEPEAHTDALASAAVREGAPATVTGSRLGAELRLLLGEPQPAALLALERHGLGAALLGPGFAVDPERVGAALALAPSDARADLVALAASLAEVDPAVLDRLEFTARERAIVVQAVAAGAAPDPARFRRLGPEAVAVAGAAAAADPVTGAAESVAAAEAARRWLEDLRHRRLAITGHDLLAAGLHGPQVGAALEAATEAMLAGEAPDRDAQLAAALAAVPPS